MRLIAASEAPCYEVEGTVCRFVHERLGWSESVAEVVDWTLHGPLHIVVVVLVAWALARLARRWIRRAVSGLVGAGDRPDDGRRRSRAQSITSVIENTVVAMIWTIALISVLGALGIELGPLIAGAGIAGIALGFGAQSLVKDCIAGLFMLAEDQYGIGDYVDLGDAVGVVERITLRATVLRGSDGTVWHVPNGVVQRVGNKTQQWSVAIVDVDVAYDTDVEQAQELLRLAADRVCEREASVVLERPLVLGVEVLAGDRITLRVTVKVQPGAQWALQRSMRSQVKAVFDHAGITVASRAAGPTAPSQPVPKAPPPRGS